MFWFAQECHTQECHREPYLDRKNTPVLSLGFLTLCQVLWGRLVERMQSNKLVVNYFMYENALCAEMLVVLLPLMVYGTFLFFK